MSTTIQELCSDIENAIDEEFPRLMEGGSEDRFIHESLDSIIPADNGSLAELLNNDNSLASIDDMGLVGDNPTVWDIIQRAAYEKVRSHGFEYFNEKKEEYEELKDELEGEGYQTGYEPGVRPRRTYIYKEDERFPEGKSIDPTTPESSLYVDELFIKGGFKSDYEAWTWLEKNLEEVQKAEDQL